MLRGTAIKRESIDALRARLLADEQVHTMIEMRAYEIYQLRGGAPGQEAEDWIQAEAEILKFLIEEETRRTETEALVAQSLARGLSDQPSTPIPNAAEVKTAVSENIAQTVQPSVRAEATEPAPPLGLAEFLTDQFTGVKPTGTPSEDQTKPKKSRPRVKAAKPAVARKEDGEKTSLRDTTKKTGSKKSGKTPKKT